MPWPNTSVDAIARYPQVCANLCENVADCLHYAQQADTLNRNGTAPCFMCDALNASKPPADCHTLVRASKGCNTAGDCVVCNDTEPSVIALLGSGHMTHATVHLSDQCTHLVHAENAVFPSDLVVRASGNVQVLGPGRFHGSITVRAGTAVTLSNLRARAADIQATDVTATRLVFNATLVIANSAGTYKVSNVTGKPFAVAVSNCQGTLTVDDLTAGKEGRCVITQDALTGTAVAVSHPTSCTVLNLSAMLGTFGDDYEMSFIDGGTYGSLLSSQFHEVATWLVIAALALTATLPLLHPTVVALVVSSLAARKKQL